MKVEGITLVITDPCYIKKSPGVTKYLDRSTIYGDWSCMCYKGDSEEAKKKSKEWNKYYFNFFNTYNFGDLNEEEKKNLSKEFAETKKAFIEGDNMINDSNVKGYTSIDDLKKSLDL